MQSNILFVLGIILFVLVIVVYLLIGIGIRYVPNPYIQRARALLYSRPTLEVKDVFLWPFLLGNVIAAAGAYYNTKLIIFHTFNADFHTAKYNEGCIIDPIIYSIDHLHPTLNTIEETLTNIEERIEKMEKNILQKNDK